MENWKQIQGYEGLYKISDRGRVISEANTFSRKEKELKAHLRCGYPTVKLYKEGKGKKFTVHRLVATQFLPNYDKHLFIHHIDENRLNAKLENLEWCSPEYNTTYSVYSGKKETPEDKRKALIYLRFYNFVEKYNLTENDISEFCKLLGRNL